MVMTIDEERISNMTSEDGISDKFIMIIILVFIVVSTELIINGIENKSNSITELKNEAPSQAQVDFMDKYGITSIEDSPIVAPVTINHYREAFDSDGEKPYEYSIVYVKDDVKHDGTIDVSVDGEVTIWDDNGAKLRPVTIDEDNKS